MDPESSNCVVVMTRDDLIAFADHIFNNAGHKGWLDARGVCDVFGLSFNNVKNAKWRSENGFPTHQPGGAYCKPMFHYSEVAEWLKMQ